MTNLVAFIGGAGDAVKGAMPSIWDVIGINPIVAILILILIVAALIGVGYLIGKNSK